MNKVPRNRLKLDIKDLNVGDKVWVSDHSIKVLKDGTAYVELECFIRHFYDKDGRISSYDTTLIEKGENGYILHIYDNIWYKTIELEENELNNLAQIVEVIDHGKEISVCEHCNGFGLVKL